MREIVRTDHTPDGDILIVRDLKEAPEELQRQIRAGSIGVRLAEGRTKCQVATLGTHPRPAGMSEKLPWPPPCKEYPTYQCNICRVLLCSNHCNGHLHAVQPVAEPVAEPEVEKGADAPEPTDADVAAALDKLSQQ